MNRFVSNHSCDFTCRLTAAQKNTKEVLRASYLSLSWLLLAPALISFVLWFGYLLDAKYGSTDFWANCIAVITFSSIFFVAFVICDRISYLFVREKFLWSELDKDEDGDGKAEQTGKYIYTYGVVLLTSLAANTALILAVHFVGHLWWLVPSIAFLLWSGLKLVIQYTLISDNLLSEPLLDEELCEQLYELADSAGLPAVEIHKLKKDSKMEDKLVFVVPAGKTARVHFAQYVLDNFSNDELAVLFAHELGHLKRKDMLVNGLVNTFLNISKWFAMALVLYLVHGYTSSPYITLAVITCAGIVVNALNPMITGFVSRINETKADQYALNLTGDPTNFKKAFERMLELLPVFNNFMIAYSLYATHPSIKSRIQSAVKWQKVRQ